MNSTLTQLQARRIALAAQGFTGRVPKTPTRKHLQRVLDQVQLIQMDSVNVAVRAHYMPLFSRLGAYDTALLHRAAWEPTTRAPRLLVEYWAHEAALIPVQDWPLFGWRRDDYADGRWWKASNIEQTHPRLRADIADALEYLGPSTSGEIEQYLGHERPATKGAWWDRSVVKGMCEAMFSAGELSATRDAKFTRYYTSPADIVGCDIAATVIGRDVAITQLMRKSATALGVGTEADLRDYYRLPVADATRAIAELVGTGELQPISVSGWKQQAYLSCDAPAPKPIRRSALLSPFDPLVFFRPRLQRLFDMNYRIEIYVPEPKRVHGYYVFPYLLDENMSARVDLKADRQASVLRVQSAHLEQGAEADAVAPRLAADLRLLAAWQRLASVEVMGKGDFAPALSEALL